MVVESQVRCVLVVDDNRMYREAVRRNLEFVGYQVLEAEDKPLYHTACSVASNLLVPLIHHAGRLLQETGIPPDERLEALLPLVQGTLQNVKKFDTNGALTGPLARGDEKTVRIQVEALAAFPETLGIYRALGAAVLEIALREKTLDPETCARLRDLLERK